MPRFSIRQLNHGCQAIDDGPATVAVVTPQGYVDWLLASPDEAGARIETIATPTHLGNVLGLKFELALPHLTAIDPASIRVEPVDNREPGH